MLVFLALSSCVEVPQKPEILDFKGNILVLCEGLMGYNNSTISLIDENSKSNPNYYSEQNIGLKLGDVAYDIQTKGDTAFISVTLSNSIEIVNIKNCKFITRIQLPKDSKPRRIFILNDTLAFVGMQELNEIWTFNPSTFKLKNEKYKSGPAPEGLFANSHNLYVLASGFGDYKQNEFNASTLQIFDIKSQQLINSIKTYPNPYKMIINQSTQNAYITYKHLPSKMNDSLGGVMEFNILQNRYTREWKSNVNDLDFNVLDDKLYLVNDEGLFSISLSFSNPKIDTILVNDKSNEHWYSLKFSQSKNEIYIGNAKNYQINGEILRYNLNEMKILSKASCGINPNSFIFVD